MAVGARHRLSKTLAVCFNGTTACDGEAEDGGNMPWYGYREHGDANITQYDELAESSAQIEYPAIGNTKNCCQTMIYNRKCMCWVCPECGNHLNRVKCHCGWKYGVGG